MTSFLVTDTIIHSISQLIDDSNNNGVYREPSHSDIEFQIVAAGLSEYDPKQRGQTIGKAKRIRAVLYAARDADPAHSTRFVTGLLGKIRASGGFRPSSMNYVGEEAIENAKAAFASQGFVLASDGSIAPKVLDSLMGHELSEALCLYAERARRGAEDAALLSGTGKDLLEAIAAHALTTLNGTYPKNLNFQSLLGMAFIALEMAVPELPEQPGEFPTKLLERGMFHSALAVNRLRNKQGTGHGRPWLPLIADHETKAAIETVGIIAGYMLAKLENKSPSRR